MAGYFNMKMKEGAIYLAPYYDFNTVLTEEQKFEIDKIVAQMLSGELDYRDYGNCDGE